MIYFLVKYFIYLFINLLEKLNLNLDRTMTPTNAEKYFGFILLKLITNDNQKRLVEFLCSHNTQTMFIGYMNTHQNQVTVKKEPPKSYNYFNIFSPLLLDFILRIKFQ